MTNGDDEAFGHGSENGHCAGLTKRELFAAMAMQGVLAGVLGETDCTASELAFDAVLHADALIEALNASA